MAPVPQGDVLHVPHSEPVHEGDAGLDAVDEPRHAVLELDHRAVLGQDDAVFCDAALPREPRVGRQHPELAVDGHHGPWSDEAEHRPQLLGVAVARHVNRGDLLVQDLGASPCQLVDRVVDAQLVPRHRLGRDDHRVPRLHLDGRVVAVGDAHERRERFALAARAEDQHLARRVLLQLVGTDQGVVGHLHVAKVSRDVHVLAHRAADDAHLAAHVDCDVDRLLHPVNVRREGGDEDAPFETRDDLAERLAHEPLRAGHARPLGIRRVAE